MESLTPPATEVITDLEFLFLGMAKALVHVLTEHDFFEDRGDHFYLRWNDVGEDALIFKTNLIQFGRRVRTVSKVDQTAVQQVVKEIKQKEARAQGAVGTVAQGSPAAGLPTATPAVDPADLWARSPLTR